MVSANRSWLLLASAVVVAAAGAVDAAAGRVWDQFVVLLFVIVLLVMSVVLGRSRRPSVTVRADLVRWMRDRSLVEGEDLDALVDRSIATYREHLDGSTTSRS